MDGSKREYSPDRGTRIRYARKKARFLIIIGSLKGPRASVRICFGEGSRAPFNSAHKK